MIRAENPPDAANDEECGDMCHFGFMTIWLYRIGPAAYAQPTKTQYTK